MRMTEELARRVLGRTRNTAPKLSESRQTELLMDWLEGRNHKELATKYKVSNITVGKIIKQARADASRVMESKK